MLKRLQAWANSAALRRCPPLPFLWSLGISQYCDYKGSAGYWLESTETCQPETFFRQHYADAHGLVWIRLSSQFRDGLPCDLDHFTSAALPLIRRPFALITTDGDISVPAEIAPATLEALLNCPWLVSWHTQNCSVVSHPIIKPFPIGLDLHSMRSWNTPQGRIRKLKSIRRHRAEISSLPLRVFCDLGLQMNSPERRAVVDELGSCAHVDFLPAPVSQAAIWKKYVQYPFVISAPGNGLDCHRTWELLYLGCIVITRSTTIDPLFEGLPVVRVANWNEVRDMSRLENWLGTYGALTEQTQVWHRLEPEAWLLPVRRALDSAQLTHCGPASGTLPGSP